MFTWTFQRSTRTSSPTWPTSVRRRQPFMHRPIQPRSRSSSYSSRCRSLSTPFVSFQQTPKKTICSAIISTMRSSGGSRRLCMERGRRGSLREKGLLVMMMMLRVTCHGIRIGRVRCGIIARRLCWSHPLMKIGITIPTISCTTTSSRSISKPR